VTDESEKRPAHKGFYDCEAVKELKSPEELEEKEMEEHSPFLLEMNRALENLRIRHLPFRFVSTDEIRELEDLRLEIVTAVTSDLHLTGYYQEAWLGITPLEPPGTAPAPFRPIAVRQLHLMERAFYLLQLHLFANAPQNAGWMNLFRRWGASARFNTLFDELARTLTQEFCRFYHIYIRDLPPSFSDRCAELTDQEAGTKAKRPSTEDDDAPLIHHPWLRREGERGQGLFMDSGLVEASVPAGSEGVGDESGTREAHETPADRSNPPGSGTTK
jgi:hypothetical protein